MKIKRNLIIGLVALVTLLAVPAVSSVSASSNGQSDITSGLTSSFPGGSQKTSKKSNYKNQQHAEAKSVTDHSHQSKSTFGNQSGNTLVQTGENHAYVSVGLLGVVVAIVGIVSVMISRHLKRLHRIL